MKNILFLNNSGNCWGGVENWIFKTARSLQKRGYNTFIAARAGSPLSKAANEFQINFKEINHLDSLTFLNPIKLYKFKNKDICPPLIKFD
jgi:hypothetical protein